MLTAENAQRLLEAWCAVSEEANLISFLDHHGFDLRLSTKVRKIWAEGPIAKLQENPYRMLAFAEWEKVDRMARSLGVTQDDPRGAAAVGGFIERTPNGGEQRSPSAFQGERLAVCYTQ